MTPPCLLGVGGQTQALPNCHRGTVADCSILVNQPGWWFLLPSACGFSFAIGTARLREGTQQYAVGWGFSDPSEAIWVSQKPDSEDMCDELASLMGAKVAGATGRGWGEGKTSAVPPAPQLIWQC